MAMALAIECRHSATRARVEREGEGFQSSSSSPRRCGRNMEKVNVEKRLQPLMPMMMWFGMKGGRRMLGGEEAVDENKIWSTMITWTIVEQVRWMVGLGMESTRGCVGRRSIMTATSRQASSIERCVDVTWTKKSHVAGDLAARSAAVEEEGEWRRGKRAEAPLTLTNSDFRSSSSSSLLDVAMDMAMSRARNQHGRKDGPMDGDDLRHKTSPEEESTLGYRGREEVEEVERESGENSAKIPTVVDGKQTDGFFSLNALKEVEQKEDGARDQGRDWDSHPEQEQEEIACRKNVPRGHRVLRGRHLARRRSCNLGQLFFPPTASVLEAFFADVEEGEASERFKQRYNFDIVNEVPLPGQLEWEILDECRSG